MSLKKIPAVLLTTVLALGQLALVATTASASSVSTNPVNANQPMSILSANLNPDGSTLSIDANQQNFSKDLWDAATATSNGYTLPLTTAGVIPVLDPAFLGSFTVLVNGQPNAVTAAGASGDRWRLNLTLATTVHSGAIVDVSYTNDTSVSDADDYMCESSDGCFPVAWNTFPVANFSLTGVNNLSTQSPTPPASTDATATFTVGGVAKVDGDTINVAAGTTSVTVVATPTDSNATAVVSGATGLVTGNNTVTVVVTAQDGTTQITTTFHVWVAASTPTVTVTPVAGGLQIDWTETGQAFTFFNFGTSSTGPFTYAPNNVCAGIAAGTTTCTLLGLSTSNSYYVVLSTTQSGSGAGFSGWTSPTGPFVALAPSTDATATFTLDGVAKVDGDIINVSAGTTSVSVGVTTTDPNASYTVSGDSNLAEGTNTVTVVVTAQDGTTQLTSTFTVEVETALAAATAAVVAAETSVAQADVTSASTLVAALPAGATKTALEARLVTVQAAIDAATAAITAATVSVVAAETAVTQASVDSASALVNALSAGSVKTALLARLAVVQAAVTAAATPPAPATTVAGAPTGVTATAGNATANVSWTAPTSNGGAVISDYAIEYSSDNGATWSAFAHTASTATSATVTGLVNGKTYVFRIKAVNSVGQSAAASSSAVTPTAPVVEPVQKSASDRTTFSGSSTALSAKQKAGLRAYFALYNGNKNLTIQVVGYAVSKSSTKASIAAATARAKAVAAFIKTLGIDATVTTKIVSKGTKAQAVFNLNWVE